MDARRINCVAAPTIHPASPLSEPAAPWPVTLLPLSSPFTPAPTSASRRGHRRSSHTGEDLAILVSRLVSAESEDEACHVATEGLAHLLHGASVALHLAHPNGGLSASSAWSTSRPDRRRRRFTASTTPDTLPQLARVTVPVVADGELWGMLVLEPRTGARRFGAPSVAMANAVAATLAQVISHRRLLATFPTWPPLVSPPGSPAVHRPPDDAHTLMDAPAAAQWVVESSSVIPDAILIADASGRVVTVNPEFRRLFDVDDDVLGASSAQVLRDVHRLLIPLDSSKYGDPRDSAFLIRRDASERMLRRDVLEITGAGGVLAGTVTVYHDITDEHQRVASKSAFLASIAHELRTPLTCISGHAQLLAQRLERSDLHDDAQSYAHSARPLRAIQRHITRIDRLLAGILDTAGLDDGTLRLDCAEVDIVPTIRAVVDEIQATTLSHTILVEMPDALVVRCDIARVEQIAYNLMSNAVKYSPEGGEIRVVVEPAPNPTGVSGVTLTVLDQGIGISEEEIGRIFSRYAPLGLGIEPRPYVPGLGLGLHVSRALAVRHGGALDVLPQRGQGAAFRLWLPLTGPQPEPSA